MKKLILIIPILLFILSCEESSPDSEQCEVCEQCEICEECEECIDCEMIVDFGYAYGGSYISANDGSSNVPSGSSYSWYLNGEYQNAGQTLRAYEPYDGFFTISLCINTPSDIESCHSKEFQIEDDVLISEDFPADTTRIIPQIDFTYSVTYNWDSSSVTIGMADASNIGSSDYVEYSWYLNGSHVGSRSAETETEYDNGHYSILHVIEVDNIEYRKSKEFEITGIK